MARLTERDFEEFKRLCDQHGIKYETDEEYRQSARDLLALAEIALAAAKEELGQKQPPG